MMRAHRHRHRLIWWVLGPIVLVVLLWAVFGWSAEPEPVPASILGERR